MLTARPPYGAESPVMAGFIRVSHEHSNEPLVDAAEASRVPTLSLIKALRLPTTADGVQQAVLSERFDQACRPSPPWPRVAPDGLGLLILAWSVGTEPGVGGDRRCPTPPRPLFSGT